MHLQTYHPPHLRHMSKREHIIIALLLRDFGSSMVTMFVPIILYVENYPLTWIGFYFVIQAFGRILTDLTLPAIFTKIGIHNTMRISLVMHFGFMIILNFIGVSELMVVFAALYAAIMYTLFWIPRHIDTLNIVSKKRSEQEIGNIEIGSAIMGISAPFLGGIIAEYLSIQLLFGVAFGVLFSASVVISREARAERRIKKVDLGSAFKRAKLWRAQVAYFGSEVQSEIAFFIWPLFIFLTIDNIGTVGGIFAVGNLAYMGIIYATARHGSKVVWFLTGTVLRIVSFIGRAFTGNVFAATVSDQAGATANGFTYPVLIDDYYKRASDGDKIANIIAVELVGDFGKLFIWSAFTLAVANLPQDAAFDLIFIGAIPFILMRLFMLREWK